MHLTKYSKGEFECWLLGLGRAYTGLTEQQMQAAIRLHDSLSSIEKSLLYTLWSASDITGCDSASAFVNEIQTELQRRHIFLKHMKEKIDETFKERLDELEKEESDAFARYEAEEAAKADQDLSERP